MLLCPVRDCHLPLARAVRTFSCPKGHSFDTARSGYVNLLQPQDRRSKQPGDTTEAVAARRRLHDLGYTAPLQQAIAEITDTGPRDVVLDAGCGDGFYLGTLAAQTGCQAHGVDISIPAIDSAARRYPGCEWIVANADRFIPYQDLTFSVILSITGRMNPAEFRRLLQPDGLVLVGLPAPDDLIELRGTGRDRVERTLADFEPNFIFTDHKRTTTIAELDASAVSDVLHSIYRPLQPREATAARVTFSLDLLLFRKRETSSI